MKKNIFFVLCLFIPCFCSAHHVILEESSGKQTMLEVGPTNTFSEVLEVAQLHLDKSSKRRSFLLPTPIELEYSSQINQFLIKAAKKPMAQPPRDYYRNVNATEKEDMRYLLDVLANESLMKISGMKSSLKKVAGRLNHLHPLQLLATVMNDSDLFSSMKKIRKRSFLWGDLSEMFAEALDQESALQNVVPHAEDFAYQISLDSTYFLHLMKNQSWEEFFDLLLAK